MAALSDTHSMVAEVVLHSNVILYIELGKSGVESGGIRKRDCKARTVKVE